LIVTTSVAGAQSPERQLAFARHLEAAGDEAFALLEYKRYIFHNPTHYEVASAHIATANIYLFYLGDVRQAKAALGNVVKNHQGSKEAKSAAKLVDFIELNSDFAGKPLVAYLEGRREVARDEPAKAVSRFLSIPKDYPQARLAPLAMLEAAKLQLNSLQDPNQAIATLNKLEFAYHHSSQYFEAQFLKAQAIEKIKGPGHEAIAAYQQVSKNDSKNTWYKKAQSEIARIKKKQNMPSRQFDKQYVRHFHVVDNRTESDIYRVALELDSELNEREIKATMEECLFQQLGQRKNEKHRVHITAYFNYPVTAAGDTNWTPGSPPNFTIHKIKSKDTIKSLLFDLLK